MGIVPASKKNTIENIFLILRDDFSCKMYFDGYFMEIVRFSKRKRNPTKLFLPYLIISVVKCISLVI